MKRYSSYKDSGVEWIGEIPSQWEVIKTFILTKNLDGKRIPLNSEQRSEMSGDIPYWGSNGIVDYINDFIFNEEIVLVGEDGSPFFDKTKPVSFYVNDRVWVNNHIHILKSGDKIIPKYITHSFNVVDYKEYITGSTRDKLTQSDLSRIPHCVPPISEQQQIVSYLDEKTSLIDTLIQSKQKKITLLKEKRTSLINQVVTKGLNPDVEMKDSGVEWIGEIPRGWSIVSGSVLGSYGKGKGIKKDEVVEEGLPCIRYGEIYTSYEHSVFKTVSYINEETTQSSISTNKGTLLITGSGETKEDIGKCIVWLGEEEVWVSGDIITLEPNEITNPEYLCYTINSESIRIQRELYGRGDIIVHIYSKNFKEMKFPLPPLSEQKEIVEYLDKETELIDKTVSIEERKIELLKEYKQSLISEVVTGKRKVVSDE